MPSATFRRLCAAIALAWMLGFVAPAAMRKAQHPDVAQYYMGGAMALRGEFDALYPIPLEGAKKNAGFTDSSTLRPGYARVAREHGVFGFNRFIYPPPSALVFVPLAALDYPDAVRVWIVLMSLCGWGLGLAAGRVHDLLVGRPTRIAGVLCLAVAGSPLMYRAVRSGNLTPAMALLLGLTMLAVRADRRAAGTAGFALGGVFKGTSAVLLPLAVLLRRWRMLVALSVVTAVAVLGSLAVMGTAPYRAFFSEVVPTLRLSTDSSANQGLAGFVMRVTGRDVLSTGWMDGLRAAGVASFVLLALLLVRRRERLRASASSYFAAVACLLALVLLFSPLAWAHYHLYVAPLWGWLLVQARSSRTDAALASACLASTYVPFCVLDPHPLPLPEPIRSHMLFGALTLLALGVRALARRTDGAQSEPSSSRSASSSTLR